MKKLFPTLTPFDPLRVTNFKTHLYWGVKDPARFKALMEEAASLVDPGYFLSDNLFTWARNNSFYEDLSFRNAWQANAQTDADTAIVWRRYILACAAFHCLHIEGDFVECGAYSGTGMKTVIDYLGGKDFPRTFWGYDTFDYHPVANLGFDQHSKEFYQQVLKRFEDYPQVKLVKGLLPDSLAGNQPEKIAYLHIDLNNLAGELAVLNALFDRITPGGMIVLDDFEWAGIYRQQKIGESEWFDKLQYRIFPLPTGQGLVIKH